MVDNIQRNALSEIQISQSKDFAVWKKLVSYETIGNLMDCGPNYNWTE